MKMKTFRDAFEESYMAVEVPCSNRKGFQIRYIYTGLWYCWDLDAPALRREKWLTGLACLASVLLFLAGALMDSPLNWSRYVSLTGTLSIAALFIEGIGAAQLCLGKERLTDLDFRAIQRKLKTAPLFHFILLVCTALFCFIQMGILGLPAWEILIPALYLLAGGCSLFIFLRYRSLPYHKEKNEYQSAREPVSGKS